VTLELTIRPFQSPEVTPPRVVPEGTKRDDPVNVSMGKEGGKTFDFSYSFSGQSKSSSDNYKEVSRRTETRRIENPDDPDQFVEIRRATEIKLVNEGDPKLKRRYRFNYPDSRTT
jgi:hypothetical protein